MKMVGVQCPNCGGNIYKENGVFVCSSCGTVVTIDYDDSDVEYERLQGEAEREERRHAHQKELLEKQYELQRQAQLDAEKIQASRQRKAAVRSAVTTWMILIIVLSVLTGAGICSYYVFKYIQPNYISVHSRRYDEDEDDEDDDDGYIFVATPTPAPNYNVTPEDVMPQMEDFVSAGQLMQMQIDQCAYWGDVGGLQYYSKTDAVFYDAYLVTDIPEVREKESNRLVIIYEVTWHNDEEDDVDQICYDAVYFEGLRVNPNGGGVITDFDPDTIIRSDAAWGWSMAYSFEEYKQCYRENITALGGKVTKVEYEVE